MGQTVSTGIDETRPMKAFAAAQRAKGRTVPTYLSRTEVAEYVGLKNVQSLTKMDLPEPDVLIGTHKGWKPATIDKWLANRPGRGNWGGRGRNI